MALVSEQAQVLAATIVDAAGREFAWAGTVGTQAVDCSLQCTCQGTPTPFLGASMQLH